MALPAGAIGSRQLGVGQDPRWSWGVFEDFVAIHWSSTHIGNLNWVAYTIAGGGGSFNFPAPTVESEIGILELYTAGGAGDQYAIAMRDEFVYSMPAGSSLLIKFKLLSTATCSAFIGLADGGALAYQQGDAVNLVGVRYDAAIDGNLYAVVKDGAGAGNESTQSLGTADTDYHEVLMTRTAAGIEVYFDRVLVGTLVTTNLASTTPFRLKMAVGDTAGAAKTAYVDYIAMWGSNERI